MRSAKKSTGSGVGTVTWLRAGRPGFFPWRQSGRSFRLTTHTHTHKQTSPSIRIKKGWGSVSTPSMYLL